VSSEAATLVVGQRTFMHAVPTDSISTPLVGRGLTWTSDTPAIVSVTAEGFVTAMAAGQGSLRATSDTTAARVAVRVIDGTTTSATSIELRPIGILSDDLARALARAVTRVRDVIDAELPDLPVRLDEGECHPSAPALDEVVDDLLVYVSETPLPRGVLGGASVCWSRAESRLPVVASILVNSHEIPLMQREGILDAVLQHELLHALGFNRGSIEQRQLAVGLAGPDPRFTGTEALAAYRSVPGRVNRDGLPPLENTGGPGTRESHWRWSDLAPELMTSYFSLGTFTPLSHLTVGALADLGYRVRSTGDDFRVLQAPAATAGLSAPRLLPVIEVHRPSRGTIDRNGRKLETRN
jgi:hypothetical protein